MTLIVADYFSMLSAELRGEKVNKTLHREALIPLLQRRSAGSVEFKHQNISAVLSEMGLPYINGYKPRYNFQKSKLIRITDEFIRTNPAIEILFKEFSDKVIEFDSVIDFSNWHVNAPERKEKQSINITRKPIKINYLQREQDNRLLGLKGEQLVFDYERSLLINAGQDSLADKVEWVARDLGDGLGFDILSKNHNGSDKYIEVKTTKQSKDSPFYFSANEYNFSIEHSSNYYLYRVYNFKTSPKLFTLNGRFDDFCRVQPINFIGKF